MEQNYKTRIIFIKTRIKLKKHEYKYKNLKQKLQKLQHNLKINNKVKKSHNHIIILNLKKNKFK